MTSEEKALLDSLTTVAAGSAEEAALLTDLADIKLAEVRAHRANCVQMQGAHVAQRAP